MAETDESEVMPNPEDLGLKIATKDEAAWLEIQKAQETRLEQLKKEIIIVQCVAELAKKMAGEAAAAPTGVS